MKIEAKIRRASLLIALGLFLQLLSLLPLHPLAFIAFVGIGVPIAAAGVILFLLSLVGDGERPAPGGIEPRSKNIQPSGRATGDGAGGRGPEAALR